MKTAHTKMYQRSIRKTEMQYHFKMCRKHYYICKFRHLQKAKIYVQIHLLRVETED